MVKQLETELPSRSAGLQLEVGGHALLLHGEVLLVDGVEVKLSPAPLAVLHALVVNPGHVVSRRDLLAALPSGTAGSEHAVEMAVARLRAAVGTRMIQTVVKRGYRLAVTSVSRTRSSPSLTAPATSAGNEVARLVADAAGARLGWPDPGLVRRAVRAALRRRHGRGRRSRPSSCRCCSRPASTCAPTCPRPSRRPPSR